jgi:hypothetical protein
MQALSRLIAWIGRLRGVQWVDHDGDEDAIVRAQA